MNAKLKSQNFQIDENISWEYAAPGIQRQVFGFDDKIMLVKVKFEQGAIGSIHEHPHSQVSYVDSGVFELTIGEEKQILKAGDGFYATPHTLHGALCIEAGILIDVFSPAREDFLSAK